MRVCVCVWERENGCVILFVCACTVCVSVFVSISGNVCISLFFCVFSLTLVRVCLLLCTHIEKESECNVHIYKKFTLMTLHKNIKPISDL